MCSLINRAAQILKHKHTFSIIFAISYFISGVFYYFKKNSNQILFWIFKKTSLNNMVLNLKEIIKEKVRKSRKIYHKNISLLYVNANQSYIYIHVTVHNLINNF